MCCVWENEILREKLLVYLPTGDLNCSKQHLYLWQIRLIYFYMHATTGSGLLGEGKGRGRGGKHSLWGHLHEAWKFCQLGERERAPYEYSGCAMHASVIREVVQCPLLALLVAPRWRTIYGARTTIIIVLFFLNLNLTETNCMQNFSCQQTWEPTINVISMANISQSLKADRNLCRII